VSLLGLILGIKRSRFRANDPRSGRADAEYKAKRPGVMSRQKLTCSGCGYVSKEARALDVHHLDDDHHNNDDANLVLACHLCHPYQHVGELGRRADVPGEGLGKSSCIVAIPEISPTDVNLLQRAMGVALLDEKEREIAGKIYAALLTRADWTKAEFQSCDPRDFAGAMTALSDEEYAHRVEAIEDQRLLFQGAHLKRVGQQFAQDYPSMPLRTWQSVHDTSLAKGKPKTAPVSA
jgi:intracellular multiplication protein IcmJ